MRGLEHDIELVGEGDLAYCNVCHCAEGSLLAYCPGFKLSAETEEACYKGNVLDLKFRTQARQARIERSKANT